MLYLCTRFQKGNHETPKKKLNEPIKGGGNTINTPGKTAIKFDAEEISKETNGSRTRPCKSVGLKERGGTVPGYKKIFEIMITTIEIDIEPQVVFDNLTAKEQNEFIDMNIDCASTEKFIDELNRRGGINI